MGSGRTMTRWMHPPELARPRDRDLFDPAVEGDRYGWSRELSLGVWGRVCSDATDSAGRHDIERVRQRFHEFAARDGRLHPDVDRVTRVGVEISGDSLGAWSADELRSRIRARETLVIAEVLGRAQTSWEVTITLDDDEDAIGRSHGVRILLASVCKHYLYRGRALLVPHIVRAGERRRGSIPE